MAALAIAIATERLRARPQPFARIIGAMIIVIGTFMVARALIAH
jgi:hypothetical protein